MAYSPEQFLQFCHDTVELKAQIKDRTLPYQGQDKPVFNSDGTMNRDILRAIRKDAYREKLSPDEEHTLAVLQQYFKRVNAFDYIIHFTGDRVAQQGAKVSEAAALVKQLEGHEPIEPDTAEKIDSVLRGTVARTGTASEAQFYNRASRVRARTVLNGDIKDLGLDLFDGYATTMDTVGTHKADDLPRASRSASDRIVDYKRRAIEELTGFYERELIPLARETARARGRDDLLPLIDQESSPVILLGGDEITVSLHSLFEELGLVPKMVAKLTEPAIANSRVAVTHSDASTSGAAGHAAAMSAGQSGQDLLKKKYEPLARALRQKARRLTPGDATRARALADLFERMYTIDEGGKTVFRSQRGDAVDVTAKETEAKMILETKELRHGH
jgi:hypothetical protein